MKTVNQVRTVSLLRSVLAVSERWYAWRASRVMLKRYQRARREDPRPSGRILYEQILSRYSGFTATAATAILEAAEQSCCSWPVTRELRFRDVVSYAVTHGYLDSHNFLRGTQTDMRSVVARVIPWEL